MIIGITGPARVGKDTTADYLIGKLGARRFMKMSFAEPIKAMLAVGLNMTVEQVSGDLKDKIDPVYGVSPRHMLQTLGTDWGRQMIHADIWVKAMARRVKGRDIIIPDVRFESEAKFIREHGVLIHIAGRGGIEGDHVSEVGVQYRIGDYTIDNSGAVEYLQAQCDFLAAKIEAQDPLRG